jgi:tetratricopeptide (TPR) repeat protein
MYFCMIRGFQIVDRNSCFYSNKPRSYITPLVHACCTMGMSDTWGLAGKVLLMVLVLGSGITVAAGQDTVVATAGEPVNATGWYDLGNSYVNEGRYDGALFAYGQAIALEQGFARAYFAKGQVLAKIGMHAEAVSAYDQAMVLDPGLAPVIESYLQTSENIVYPEIASGSLLSGYWVSGYQYLVVDNQYGASDVVVAIAPTGINASTAAVYVKKGYINAFDGIVPPGSYTFYITSGERWNSFENRFDENARYIVWTPPQYTYGATGYGYTLVISGQQVYYPNWYVYNLQEIPESSFPAF